MSSDPKGDGLFVDEKPTAAKPKAASAGSAAPKAKDVKRRWMYVGIIVVVFIIVISTVTHTTPPPPAKHEGPTKLINTNPDGLDNATWQAKSEQQLKDIQRKADEREHELNGVKAELAELKAHPPVASPPSSSNLPAGVVPPPTMINGVSTASGNATVVPPPPITIPPVTNTIPPVPTGSSRNNNGSSITTLPSIPPPYGDGPPVSAEPMVFAPERGSSRSTAGIDPVDGVDAKVKYRKNAQNGLMVAGAFAPVVLLNGIEAATSSGARSNPLPILIRVQDNAILPGAARYQLKSCFMLGSGYGDLSAERVYVRLARLSCIDINDRLVLSVPVQGYVVDSDNTLGMRGKVVDRQGARLGKALLAGFAQGLSGALGGAQGDTTSSALGTATSISGSAALRASGLGGISSASSQLAQFYLKEAESIFPVIEVEGGRTGTVVVSEDANLSWGNVDEQFVREVTPTNK